MDYHISKIGLLGIVNPRLKREVKECHPDYTGPVSTGMDTTAGEVESDATKVSLQDRSQSPRSEDEYSESDCENILNQISQILVTRLTRTKSFYQNIKRLSSDYEYECKDYLTYLENLLELLKMYHSKQSPEFINELLNNID